MTTKMSQEVIKSDAKAVENNSKKETKVMKEDKKDVKVETNAVIMDKTDSTDAKIKALNTKKPKKGGSADKKPAKRTKKPTKTTKGGGKMSHNENLVKVLADCAKKNKDLELNIREDKGGVPTTFQLKRGGDIIVTIRKTDIVACRPRKFFAKALLNKTPYFKLHDKKLGVEAFTHFTHIKKAVEVDVFKAIVTKAITSKKTVGEWKTEMKAIGKSRVSKKTPKQKMMELEASIKRQKAELDALKSAKTKLRKGSKAKATKTKKPVSAAVSKVADAVA